MLDTIMGGLAKMGGRVLPNYKLDKQATLESIELRWSCYGASPSNTGAGQMPLTAFVFEKKLADKCSKQNKEAVGGGENWDQIKKYTLL